MSLFNFNKQNVALRRMCSDRAFFILLLSRVDDFSAMFAMCALFSVWNGRHSATATVVVNLLMEREKKIIRIVDIPNITFSLLL